MNEQYSHSTYAGQLPAVSAGREVAAYNPYVLSEQESADIDLRQIWSVIRRYRWLILSVVVVAVVTTAILTAMMRPVYRATALVELKPNPAIISFESVGRNPRNADAFRNTQQNIMRSEAVAQRVISEMNLAENPEFTGELRQRGPAMAVRILKREIHAFAGILADALTTLDAAEKPVADSKSADDSGDESREYRSERQVLTTYMNKLDIEQVDNSDLMHVSVESFSPRTAAELANAHTRQYIWFTDERRFNSTSSAKKYLQERIEEAEANLEASEKALTDFARSHNIVDVEDRGNVMESQYEDLSRALTQKRQERIMAEIEYKQAQEGDLETLPAVQGNQLIEDLRRNYADIRAEYQEMSRTFKETYPRMQQLKSRMENMRSTLQEESEKLVAGLQKRHEQLKSQEYELEQQMENQRMELLDLKERAISYNILKREWEANRELYTGLLEKQKDFSVASGMEFNDATIVDEAVTPTSQYKPDGVKNVTMAGVFGLVGGMGIAFLLAFLDNTFKTREELERTLGIPFMGIVPKLATGRERALVPTALISAYLPSNSIAEAIRSIRTGMLFSRPEQVPKKILVTSTTSGEGKSTIALNLAVILAQNGSNVVIVDADLRKPSIARCLNIDSSIGLAEYLDGQNIDIVTSTAFENLFVVPAGGECTRPTDLLASIRMRDYLNELSERFDFVLIDSPPCLGLADSLLLSAKVDGTLLVVKAGSTEKHVVAETVNRLRMVNAPVIGSILNNVDLHHPEYGYYGSYYGRGDNNLRTDMVRKGDIA